MPVNLIIRNPLDWDALAIARNANGANRRELSDYVRFLKAQGVWNDLGFFRDFANAKSLNHSFGPNIAFTRASIATYFDSGGTLRTAAAGEPRIDHDPAAAGNPSRGLLIEESRTNLLLRSADFTTTWASPQFAGTANPPVTVSSNTDVAPDGTTTADTIVDVGSTSNQSDGPPVTFDDDLIQQAVSGIVSDGTYTFSVFIKKTTGAATFPAIRLLFSSGATALQTLTVLDTNNGTTVSSVTGSPIVAVVSVGAYWRVCITCTNNNTGNTSCTARICPAFNDSLSLTGDAATTAKNSITGSIVVWGAQLEQGAFPTSYIPTTTAAVTRSADSAVVTPISSFYNQSEGTLFAEASRTHVAKVVSFLVMLKSDESPVASFLGLESGVASPAQQRFQVSGGTGTALLNFADGVANTVYRMAGAYALNDFIGAQNGTLTSADTSGTAPATQDRMTIGMGATTAVPFYGGSQCHIRRIAYWPRRLSNALLETLTT
jgi:hypothetical protein